MKKKITLLILILAMLFSITACGSDGKFKLYTGPIIMTQI